MSPAAVESYRQSQMRRRTEGEWLPSPFESLPEGWSESGPHSQKMDRNTCKNQFSLHVLFLFTCLEFLTSNQICQFKGKKNVTFYFFLQLLIHNKKFSGCLFSITTVSILISVHSNFSRIYFVEKNRTIMNKLTFNFFNLQIKLHIAP